MTTTYVKRIGYGCSLACDPTGGTVFAAIAAVVDGWDGPDVKADEVDTTILGDHYKTSQPAQYDPGTVTYQIVYSPEDTATTQVLTGLVGSGAVANWQITLSAQNGGTAQNKTFLGYVSGFKPTVKTKSAVVADITIRLSGTPDL